MSHASSGSMAVLFDASGGIWERVPAACVVTRRDTSLLTAKPKSPIYKIYIERGQRSLRGVKESG